MGFLDKAKAAAQQAEAKLNEATGGLNQGQQTRVADTWLKELGQWVYAERMGRDPRAAAEIEVRLTQIQQWEQQNGTQVSTPMPSPGTGGDVTVGGAGAPSPEAAAIPGAADIPGAATPPSGAPEESIPGTFSTVAEVPSGPPPETAGPATSTAATTPATTGPPGDAAVPTPGPSLGVLEEPTDGEPTASPPVVGGPVSPPSATPGPPSGSPGPPPGTPGPPSGTPGPPGT